MTSWLRIASAIDRLNAWIGRSASWFALVMVLLGAFNAVTRYLGRYLGTNLSSNVYIEGQWYLFSLLFLLGTAYTLQRNQHVRVDVIYSRLSTRGQAWIDVLGTVLFLLPFTVTMMWLTWPSVRNSWVVRETSPDPGGLVRYPLKAMILVCFLALTLQGLALLIQRIAFLRGQLELPPSSDSEPGGVS
jgi:TRAP-type mannitol/chloroaromatic compound transport system permease small subunit